MGGGLALCLLVLLAGCDKKALEQAQQEAREAKTTVQQLKHNLSLAEKEIADMKAELDAVRQSRDELQGTIDRAVQERDAALDLSEKANETLVTRTSGQTSAMAELQKQIAELNALVAEQQKVIDQYEKNAEVEPVDLPPDDLPPPDPNEGL
jgi:chromosome segregation ATPase